jgi:hypothetical protein
MKTEPIFGGKWLRVIDDIVDYDAAARILRCYRVAGLRITGNIAPFGGSWIQQGNEIILTEAPTQQLLKRLGGPSKS